MGYVDFESDGVDYRLFYVTHLGHNKKNTFDGLDAVVFETGSFNQIPDYTKVTEGSAVFNNLDEINENNISLYSVDNKGRNSLINFATNFGHFIPLGAIAYGISNLAGAGDDTAAYIGSGTIVGQCANYAIPVLFNNGISKFFAKISSALSLIRQGPREELRNALTAKKIKKGVVPHLLEQYPDRFLNQNPRIGIMYGSAHSGIKECLESDLRTNFSLGLHKNYGMRFILDKDTLTDIVEYKVNKNGDLNYNIMKVELI